MTDPRVTGPWDLGNKSYIVTGRDFIKFSRLGSIPSPSGSISTRTNDEWPHLILSTAI